MKLTTSLMIATLASGTLWAQSPAIPAITPAKPSATTQTAAKPAPATAKPAAVKPGPAITKAAPAVKPAPIMTKAAPVATKAVPVAAKPVPVKPAPAVTKAVPVTAKPGLIASPQAPAPAKKPAVAETHKPVAVEKKKPATPKATKAEVPVQVAKPASAKEATATRVSTSAGKRDPFVSPIVRATAGGGAICETGKRCLMVDQIQLKGIVKSPNGYIAVVENPLKRAYFLRENDPVFNGSVIKITGDTVVFREATTDKLGKQGAREVVKKVNAPVV